VIHGVIRRMAHGDGSTRATATTRTALDRAHGVAADSVWSNPERRPAKDYPIRAATFILMVPSRGKLHVLVQLVHGRTTLESPPSRLTMLNTARTIHACKLGLPASA